MPTPLRESSRSRTFGRPSRTPRGAAMAAGVIGLLLSALTFPGTSGTIGADATNVSVSDPDGTIVDPLGFPTKAQASLTSGDCTSPGAQRAAVTLPDRD